MKNSHCEILKPLVSKFRSDLSVSNPFIAEKQAPAKLKPIVDVEVPSSQDQEGTEQSGIRLTSKVLSA